MDQIRDGSPTHPESKEILLEPSYQGVGGHCRRISTGTIDSGPSPRVYKGSDILKT